jgi:hypothetical protein
MIYQIYCASVMQVRQIFIEIFFCKLRYDINKPFSGQELGEVVSLSQFVFTLLHTQSSLCVNYVLNLIANSVDSVFQSKNRFRTKIPSSCTELEHLLK